MIAKYIAIVALVSGPTLAQTVSAPLTLDQLKQADDFCNQPVHRRDISSRAELSSRYVAGFEWCVTVDDAYKKQRDIAASRDETQNPAMKAAHDAARALGDNR